MTSSARPWSGPGAHGRACGGRAGYGEADNPLQRVYGFIDFIAEAYRPRDEPRSCFFGNLTQEVSRNHEEIRQGCSATFGRWAEWFRVDLEEAVRAGGSARTVGPAGLASHIIAVYEGSLILAKAHQDPALVVDGMLHSRRYLECIFAESQSVIQGRVRGKRRTG